MDKLEDYLLNNNTISYEYFANNYKLFNYDNYKELKIDLDFLLYNLYTNINITNLQQKEQRLDQNSFRKELIKKYNKCLISDSIDIECEACHIIPYSICKNFDIDNGLLLSSDLHKTFDKYYWSINPNTLKIEINKNINGCGKIKKYENVQINLNLNNNIYNNLLYHYNIFIKKV